MMKFRSEAHTHTTNWNFVGSFCTSKAVVEHPAVLMVRFVCRLLDGCSAEKWTVFRGMGDKRIERLGMCLAEMKLPTKVH